MTRSPGRGSTFTVKVLSAAAPDTDESYEATPLPGGETRAAGSRQILYIEDNLANLTLIERLFAARPGIQLRPAMQGRLGLELASQERPDLVILDLHLPDMSGREVVDALKRDSLLANVPVIIASADATPGQVQRLLDAGAEAYLTKPIDIRELLALVDRLLDR